MESIHKVFPFSLREGKILALTMNTREINACPGNRNEACGRIAQVGSWEWKREGREEEREAERKKGRERGRRE